MAISKSSSWMAMLDQATKRGHELDMYGSSDVRVGVPGRLGRKLVSEASYAPPFPAQPQPAQKPVPVKVKSDPANYLPPTLEDELVQFVLEQVASW